MIFCVSYSKEKYQCRVKIHAKKVISINFYQSNISHSDNIDFDENIFYTFYTICVADGVQNQNGVSFGV